MKVVIVGAGAVGLQIAKQLIDEKKDVALIEQDAERARIAVNRLDCMVINRPGNSLEALREAGTESADFFIAVTDSDEVNLISCVLAGGENAALFKIARVRNIDYSSTPIAEEGFLGINFVVNPEVVAAQAIIRTIEHGAISDIMFFEQSKTQMRHLTVEAESPIADRKLSEIGHAFGVTFLVAVILRDNNFIIPSGETVLHRGDILYVVATEESFDVLYDRLGTEKMDLRRVVIVGGGKIGAMIADHLLDGQKKSEGVIRRLMKVFSESRRRSVKIIDRDYARCKELSEQLPGALVINADVSDEGVFEEEHFANTDLIISVTANQELNLVTAVYAKTLGIKRSIALVGKTTYTRIASQLGIDVPVSLKNSVANTILKLVRKGNVRSIHSISEGSLEVMEISVDGHSVAAGKRISEVRLPQGALVVSVLRDDQNIIPDGEYVLQGGDHIIIIARIEFIERIQALFTAVA
ncbi:MAG: Trk system potassium transporter TrkA [Spirochaetales bacterium]|nr:Trk system potassium transporter TrkA [Spirochaetales bacterium]